MVQLPTSNEYVTDFIASESRHFAVWYRSRTPNMNAISLEDTLQQNDAYLLLTYDNNCHLTTLTYHFTEYHAPPTPPVNRVLLLFQNNLWHDLAFNQIQSRDITDAVRRIKQYWTPSHWRGF